VKYTKCDKRDMT